MSLWATSIFDQNDRELLPSCNAFFFSWGMNEIFGHQELQYGNRKLALSHQLAPLLKLISNPVNSTERWMFLGS